MSLRVEMIQLTIRFYGIGKKMPYDLITHQSWDRCEIVDVTEVCACMPIIFVLAMQ